MGDNCTLIKIVNKDQLCVHVSKSHLGWAEGHFLIQCPSGEIIFWAPPSAASLFFCKMYDYIIILHFY